MSKLINIIHMGDSITFGQYVDSRYRWTELIKNYFNLKYYETDINFNFLNCGISGETSRMGLNRFAQDIQINSPDIMTLQFGLNDCNCWLNEKGLHRVSPLNFKSNMIEMIDCSC